jgi:hypothetical protein
VCLHGPTWPGTDVAWFRTIHVYDAGFVRDARYDGVTNHHNESTGTAAGVNATGTGAGVNAPGAATCTHTRACSAARGRADVVGRAH